MRRKMIQEDSIWSCMLACSGGRVQNDHGSFWSVPVPILEKPGRNTALEDLLEWLLADLLVLQISYFSDLSYQEQQLCQVSFVADHLGIIQQVFLNSHTDENKLPFEISFKLSRNCTVLSQSCCSVMACLAKVSRDLKTLGMRCSCGMNPGSGARLTQSSHLQQDSRGHHWANARNLLICLCLTKPIIFLIVILFIIFLYL